jgi:hypothetical protein
LWLEAEVCFVLFSFSPSYFPPRHQFSTANVDYKGLAITISNLEKEISSLFFAKMSSLDEITQDSQAFSPVKVQVSSHASYINGNKLTEDFRLI